MNSELPSFYGCWAWAVVTLALIVSGNYYGDIAVSSIMLGIMTSIVFYISNTANSKNAKRYTQSAIGINKIWLVSMLAIGVIFTIMYLSLIASEFTGSGISADVSDAENYRVNSGNVETMSTQIGYLSWFSLGVLSATWKENGKYVNIVVCVALGILVYAEFLIASRMRVLWILFIVVYPHLKRISSFGWLALTFVGLTLFVLNGWATGKIGSDGLDSAVSSILAYAVGGFVYLNDVFDGRISPDPNYLLTMRRILVILERFDLIDKITGSEHLEFYEFNNGFVTNVSTFYYNYIVDYGFIGVVFALLLYSFGLDWFWLFLEKKMTSYTEPLQATLCFITLISIFADQIQSFVLITMILLTIVCVMLKEYKCLKA